MIIKSGMNLVNGEDEMSKLKPCPFCGAEVQDDERGEKYPRKSPMGGWIIHCECCGASLSQFRKSGKGEISWNTRPIEDALNKRIAELEAERRWIPVGERLPEDGEVVWLWDGNNLGMGYYLVFTGQFMDRDTPLRRIKPTHWMPLPNPPEAK